MKRLYNYPLMVLFIITFCSAKTDEKQFDEYLGGRFGYSVVNIKLYNDSTYYYTEWNHTGRSIKDNGKWDKINDRYYLNSKSKIKWNSHIGRSNKINRFESQEFIISNDTLRFVPKEGKDIEYFDLNYSLLKFTNSKNK